MKTGLLTEHINPNVRPQDNLYRHVNGHWVDSAEIPADRAGDGASYELYQTAEKQVRAIIEELAASGHKPGSNAQKIGDLYAAFMDEAKIEALGISPIQTDLDLALSVKTAADFHAVLGAFEAKGVGGLFYEYITTDNKDSNTNIAYLGQSGLSLPDEAYYREDEYQPIREALLIHIEKMFALANVPDAANRAKLILALETEIASHHWDQVKDRDALLTYNKFTRAEIEALSPGINWSLWMSNSKTPEKLLATAILRQPSFFTGVGKMLQNFDAESWSAWLGWHLISGAAPYLTAAIVQQNFSFYATTLSGVPTLRERWKRGVGLIENALGEAVGEIYVQRHFPPAAKERMLELVGNLLAAYRVDIAALNWMSDETKERAFDKLNKFRTKIGYPDKWRNYEKLEVVPGELISNLGRLAKFEQDYEYAKIGAPVDREEWLMTPQTVNAYYMAGMNEIVFPAASLQAPFFTLDGDDAANYGGIGAVIGHEIGHGFDDQGSEYDGDGNLNNWWLDSDRAEFEKRAAVLIAQYDSLSPVEAPDLHVNGALTIGENIGDLGGLTIALKAYEIALNGASAPILGGFTGQQRLFFGWAQSWRAKFRGEEVRRRIATDPHSPDEIRCNQVVRNLAEFYEAFDVKPADGLYLSPDQRVRIW